MNNLRPPATLERLIGYRGFRTPGFVAGSDDNLFTIDTDLARMEWEKHLNASAPAQASSLTPVVFEYKGKTLLVAAAKDGSLHLVDGANLSAALFTTAASANDFAPGALASWEESGGARWILVAHTGALPAGFNFPAQGFSIHNRVGFAQRFGWRGIAQITRYRAYL
jgi:hypothetical protein